MSGTHPRGRAMRARPDLDQLKRQAKELLTAYAQGQPDAVAEVQAHYRGAARATFALHDAQLVVARAYGYDSWSKLKAFVDGVTVRRLADAVRRGDLAETEAMLAKRPELTQMDMAENDEHRALHYAVFARSPEMVRLLMRHGADARQGIYPHRDATNALTIATERGWDDIVAVILEEEERRRAARSGADPATSAAEATPQASAQDQLVEAIVDGDRATAMATLAADPASVRAPNRDGWTPLHAAASMLDEPLVRALLDQGADSNAPGPDGRTPIDVADGRGWRRSKGLERYPAVAALLRARGAELTARSAVALGEAEWLRARHAAGALANPIDGPGGLLSIAARHDRADMLALLLDLGLDPDERHRLGSIEEPVFSSGHPLHHCAGLGKHAMAALLLERGADPNAEVYASGAVMYSALKAGDAAMVELLRRHGGIIDAATAGWLGLTSEARRMFEEDDAGRLTPGTIREGQTLADVLLWSGTNGGDPEIVRMALARLTSQRDDPGLVWQMASALPGGSPRAPTDRARYRECFRQILERSDPTVRHPRFGRTLLHDVATLPDAVAEEAVEVATLLLDAGARLDVRDDVLLSTPLGWACRWGSGAMAGFLVARGAKVEEPDAEPWARPRAWAARSGVRL